MGKCFKGIVKTFSFNSPFVAVVGLNGGAVMHKFKVRS